jgi:bacillithiol system protein YtxJ
MLQQLTTCEQADEVLAAELAVVYKHSTRCPLSGDAMDEVERFIRDHGHVPVYLVDVLQHRPVARHIAERTVTTHHSPQVIVVRGGVTAWTASHYQITARELERQTLGG